MKFYIKPLTSTTTKVVMTIIITAITIGSSIGIISYHNSSIALKDNKINSLIIRAEENADLVYRIIDSFKTNIEGIAFRTEIMTMDWSIQKPVLISETRRLGILRLQVADKSGRANSTNDTVFDISDREHFKRALQGETSISEPLVSKSDGQIVIICATPIRNNEGTIAGVLTAALDPDFLFNIIKNRKIEKTGYGIILNNNGVIIAHPDKKLILSDAAATWKGNNGFEELSKIIKEMMNGKTGFGYYKYYGEDKCISYAPVPGSNWSIGLTAPSTEVFDRFYGLRSKFIFVTILAMLISIGLSISILIYIVERNKTNKLRVDVETSNRLLKESEEMDKLRTQFFANISHELRTPLNVISSTIQLCEMYVKADPALAIIEKHLKILKVNSGRLLRLINNLIDTARIDAGFIEVSLENHNIVNIVEDIVLSTVEYAKSKDIKLVFDTMTEELVIAIDAEKIERVVLNLLSNAIKFTEPGGSIFVNIYVETDWAVISVKDTGIGIPKEKLKAIFDRFIRVEQSFARSHEGSGIGLSLVKSLVEMHKGKVSVSSEAGKGSEFTVELPLTVIEETACEMKDASSSKMFNNTAEKVKREYSDIYIDA